MAPCATSHGQPSRGPGIGDILHITFNGPAVLVHIETGRGDSCYQVEYPDGTREFVQRAQIVAHEGVGAASLVGSPRGPGPLLYLGRAFDDPGRSINTFPAAFSLVATMVGGGVLSLPYAVSQNGLALGTLVLLLSGAASAWTLDMLVECARRTGFDTFELIGHAAFGEYCRKSTLAILFIICWLTMIAYFVLIGDMLHPVAELLIPPLKSGVSAINSRRLVVGVAALVLSPMCFKNNLASLKFMCFISVGSVLLVSLVVILRAVEVLGEASHDVQARLADQSIVTVSISPHYQLWPADWLNALYVFPMFGVSFLCHFNALPTHYELQRPTQSRMRHVVILTTTFASFLYLVIGIFGYLYSGRCTCGNILLNFRENDGLVAIARTALSLVLMLNFPLICQPCRNALFRSLQSSWCCRSSPALATLGEGVLNAEPERSAHSHNSGGSSSTWVHVYRREDAQGPAGHNMLLDTCDIFPPKDKMVQQSAAEPSRLRRYGLTFGLLLSALAVSFFLQSILVVWSILGSTVAMLVAFILPSLFWYKIVGCTASRMKRGSVRVFLGVFMLLMAVCMVLTCLHLGEPPCPGPPPTAPLISAEWQYF